MKILTYIFCISVYCIAQHDSLKKDFEYTTVYPDEPVQLVGGLDSLQSKLQYPIEAVQHGIEGSVIIQVTIDSSGSPLNPRILKGLGYSCNEEAIRLLLSAKYLPAVFRGKNVKTQINFRIKFKLP